MMLDCSSLSKVKKFAAAWKKSGREIDYLFLNAGIADKPQNVSRFTDEGFELVYVTNHLGPFLLTALISPFLSPSARIIQTSSAAAFGASFAKDLKPKSKAKMVEVGFHSPKWSPSFLPQPGFYSQSKAMQVVFANQLQLQFDRNGSQGKLSASYHPGYVATNIFNALQFQGAWTKVATAFMNATALTPKQGAQTALWLSLSREDVEAGGFYDRSNSLALPWYKFHTQEQTDRLWARWNADAGLTQSDWHF
ncbi:hypothetical protein CBS101457_004437 [Exobasidium rhododendri]|nr:hypothetical protein CBS101457_004437 [Exobasidium rhododendri]